MKWTGRIIHRDWSAEDAGVDGLPIIKQSIPICTGIHRFEYEIQKDGIFDDGAYAVQRDCC